MQFSGYRTELRLAYLGQKGEVQVYPHLKDMLQWHFGQLRPNRKMLGDIHHDILQPARV